MLYLNNFKKLSNVELSPNFIMKLLKSDEMLREVLECFRYSFIDVDETSISNFIAKIKNEPVYLNDTALIKKIYRWYTELASVEVIGFTLSDHEHRLNKVKNIVQIIKNSFPMKKLLT